MNNFHIGQPVVCIDDKIGHYTFRKTLTEGQVYTIRGFDTFCDEIGVYLEEVHLGNYPDNSPWPGIEICFKMRRFRPVITKSTDAGVAALKEIAADISRERRVPPGYKRVVITESVD